MFIVLKLLIFGGFLYVVFFTWASQELDMLIALATSLILVPIIAIIYSYSIFNIQYMARRRSNDENQREGQNEDNNGRRLGDAADLDER